MNRGEFNLNESLSNEIEKQKQLTSNFFAYDERLKNRGRSEFKDLWGNRVLEDNWRREDKNSFTFEEIATKTNEENKDSLEADLAAILRGIPSNDSELEAAHKKFKMPCLILECFIAKK